MADMKDKEKIASLLASSITAGIKNLEPVFKAAYCGLKGETDKESTLATLMATQARLTALEIVLMQSGVPALGVTCRSLSELMFEVRRGTVVTHVISKALSKHDAQQLFPDLKIEEVLGHDWEKQAAEQDLAKTLRVVSDIAKSSELKT